MENINKQAIVLFSGGIDSTYMVTQCAGDYEKLACITYKTPGMLNVGFSAINAGKLRKIFGEKITHEIIDISAVVLETRGGVADCLRDNLKYGYFYSWCLGCKLSMLLATIKYCKDRGINTVLDGSNKYDEHALEQQKPVKDLFASFYNSEGIEYLSPCYYDRDLVIPSDKLTAVRRHIGIYRDTTEKRRALLEKMGFNFGMGVGAQYRKTQPSCVPSLFFNGARVLLKTLKKEKTKNYRAYLNDKYSVYTGKTAGGAEGKVRVT